MVVEAESKSQLKIRSFTIYSEFLRLQPRMKSRNLSERLLLRPILIREETQKRYVNIIELKDIYLSIFVYSSRKLLLPMKLLVMRRREICMTSMEKRV